MMVALVHRVTYETPSCVRGFHIHQDIWTPVIGEESLCEREEGNLYNRYAVSVLDLSTVVGHFPSEGTFVTSSLAASLAFRLTN